MARYVVRRILALVAVLFAVTLLSFSLGRIAPGDPAELLLERSLGFPPSDREVELKREELGLDRSYISQYADWLGGVAKGDLGVSWSNGERVSGILITRVPRTVLLAVSSLVLGLAMAVPVGVVSAYHHGRRIDNWSRLVACLGASLPAFFVGYLLIFVFAARLKWFPVFGYGTPRHLVLPSLTLALAAMAEYMRLTRSTVLESLAEGYVTTALAKGASTSRMLFRHALRNALLPMISLTGLRFGYLLGGAVIVEWIFGWPGLGKLTIDAIYERDYALIQGAVLLAGVGVVLVNLAADLAYAWADPRVRLQPRDL